jgi:adenosylcobinamide amidohydrolase
MVLSTLEGFRTDIRTIGNHYASPPCWCIGHGHGLEGLRAKIFHVIQKSEKSTSFLFTGADMGNLAIKRKQFKALAVYALVTAGVQSNAVRMSKDEGAFYEPGTINVILLPNVALTQRAMARAIISATEAKTAALQDLDIRSSHRPSLHQATGTGTDNILIASGIGPRIDQTGGHTKMGELVATAVYEAVQEAIHKQNGIVAGRPIFRRLKERKITLFDLVSTDQCDCLLPESDLAVALEHLLLEPRYSGFVELALGLSDDYEKGMVKDLQSFEELCKTMSSEVAGQAVDRRIDLVVQKNLSKPLKMALNALLNGLYHRSK